MNYCTIHPLPNQLHQQLNSTKLQLKIHHDCDQDDNGEDDSVHLIH